MFLRLCFSFLYWVKTPPPRKPVISTAFPWLGRAMIRHEIANSFNVLVYLTLVLSRMMQHSCHPSFYPPSVIWERMKKWRFHRCIGENSQSIETSWHPKFFNCFSHEPYLEKQPNKEMILSRLISWTLWKLGSSLFRSLMNGRTLAK